VELGRNNPVRFHFLIYFITSFSFGFGSRLPDSFRISAHLVLLTMRSIFMPISSRRQILLRKRQITPRSPLCPRYPVRASYRQFVYNISPIVIIIGSLCSIHIIPLRQFN
jgi:hypothetical protein